VTLYGMREYFPFHFGSVTASLNVALPPLLLAVDVTVGTDNMEMKWQVFTGDHGFVFTCLTILFATLQISSLKF
jgi:hypothetical protein